MSPLSSDPDADRPVRKVVTDRSAGNLADHVGDDPEAVAANRARLAELIDLPVSSVVYMEQIHSPNVTEVTEELLESLDGAAVDVTDALVTTLPGIALAVLTADCVPVLLSDDEAGVVAAVHAGRIGARNGIVARTVEHMVDLGATPSRIHALLGAAAAGEDYEVPESMAEDVESRLPGSRTVTAAGTPGLDIRAGVTRQLLGMGVRAIDADPRSTITSENFYSYRREGVTGRQAGVVWMPSGVSASAAAD
ncbi:MAG TPA: peptidoglycan editing factor PgeF [Candidatus Corynebacterium avicola]|uniref:Purine nucleoside phosphorylase n=1 Tax=Candidatus Corynebacterium avicola TaxID=2838527 RepID=A0A9D1RNX1_9CORY|nr:peptidoglycan editing factor PgeF [Candidatus Corynebacterium avicola]